MVRYRNRRDAGRQLADRVLELDLERPVILALPRGGVPVAYEVAHALHGPLDVVVARKLGAPGHPGFGIGAIAEGLEDPVITATAFHLGVTDGQIRDLVERERRELDRRIEHYRGDRDLPELAGRDVVVVDDGLATGATAEAALRALRTRAPRRLVLAVPVGAEDAVDRLGRIADDVVCPLLPPSFQAVGMWYDDFGQTSDDEVLALLAAARPATSQPTTSQTTTSRPAASQAAGEAGPPSRTGPVQEQPVDIRQVDGTVVHGDLTVPEGAIGVVVFAHGSGSSRHSRRNREVAATLQHHRIATLLMDLLTEEEERAERHTGHLNFDIDLLADRLVGAIGWLHTVPAASGLPVGCFGASTGGAAALVAAARRSDAVSAVVSRGGRPDLAGDRLGDVQAPTLLIVGSDDEVVLDLNQQACDKMTAPRRLVVIPGATHLFEEPGALHQVAALAADWFTDHLPGAAPSPPPNPEP